MQSKFGQVHVNEKRYISHMQNASFKYRGARSLNFGMILHLQPCLLMQAAMDMT